MYVCVVGLGNREGRMVSRPYVKVKGSGVSHIGKSEYTGKTLRTVLSMYKGSIHVSCDCCHHTARKVCPSSLLTGHGELRALCLHPSRSSLLPNIGVGVASPPTAMAVAFSLKERNLCPS